MTPEERKERFSRTARRARVDLERSLRRLASHRAPGASDARREEIRLPLFDRPIALSTVVRLLEAVLGPLAGGRRRLAIALLFGRQLVEVVDLVWGTPGEPIHRSLPFETTLDGSRADGSFAAAVGRTVREAIGDSAVPVVAFDVRLLGALRGSSQDDLDRLTKLVLLLAKGVRGRLLWIDPSPTAAGWIEALGRLRVRPALLSWFLRRSLPDGRFALLVTASTGPLAIVVDATGSKVALRVDADPIPPAARRAGDLDEATRAVRQALGASLAAGHDPRRGAWSLSTRSEVLDLPRLWEALAPAFPGASDLAAAGWTLPNLRRILGKRWRAGLDRLRRSHVLFDLTDGEEFWAVAWNGRALVETGRGVSETEPGEAREATDSAGRTSLEFPIDLPTLRWVLGLFLESGPSRLVSLAADRLPDGATQSIDLDEALVLVELEDPAGQPEQLLISGGTYHYLHRHWQGDAHLVHLAVGAGRVLDRRVLPETPLSLEGRSGSVAIRFPADWRAALGLESAEPWSLRPEAESDFDTGLAASLSPSSELDRLAPGLRSRVRVGRVALPIGALDLPGGRRRIVSAAAYLRSGRGLAYASILATRRATLSVLLGPAPDPWAILFATAWPAVGEAAPGWLSAATRRTERLGLLLGGDGSTHTFREGAFEFEIDSTGRLHGAPAILAPVRVPIHLSVLDATSVPVEPSGVHLLRVRFLAEAGGRFGFGVLDHPHVARSADRVLEVAVRAAPGEVHLRVGDRDVLTLVGPTFGVHEPRPRTRLTDVATDWWRRAVGKKSP